MIKGTVFGFSEREFEGRKYYQVTGVTQDKELVQFSAKLDSGIKEGQPFHTEVYVDYKNHFKVRVVLD